MEHTNKTLKDKLQVVMVIGIYLAIIILLIAIIILVKNINEIKTDPLVYGMEKHDFDSCSCYNSEGRMFEIINQNNIIYP